MTREAFLIHVDLRPFIKALREATRAMAATRGETAFLGRALRRAERLQNQVRETPRRSRMHAQYRTKTRRRNRR